MAFNANLRKALAEELERLYIDSSYSAQCYFEAAKSATFWGRSMVLIPALTSSFASLVVAIGWSKSWGALGAVAGAVAATVAFLGYERKVASYLNSARKFTDLRHSAQLEVALAATSSDANALEARLRSLREDYSSITDNAEPVSNRFFRKAQKRIAAGVLQYEDE